MFSKEDVKSIEGRGTSVGKVESQVERFKKGFPWMDIVAPATPERGIKVLDEDGIRAAVSYCDNASVAGKCKFVPASGAASRMFKDIFAGLASLEEGNDPGADSSVGNWLRRSVISLSIRRQCSENLPTRLIIEKMWLRKS